jgi:hypothetical protein
MTVLQELVESMNADPLAAALSAHGCLSDTQRLGWALEASEHPALADVVNGYLKALPGDRRQVNGPT